MVGDHLRHCPTVLKFLVENSTKANLNSFYASSSFYWSAHWLMTEMQKMGFWQQVLCEVNDAQNYLQTEGMNIHLCAQKIRALQTILEAKREEFTDDALIYAESLSEELENSFEPPRRIRRKHIFGNGKAQRLEHNEIVTSVQEESDPVDDETKEGVSAVQTLLGWTILGLGKKREVVNLVTLSLQNMDVPEMWDLEVLGITDPIEKKNESLLEEETLAHFKETIRNCEDQRYELAL
ncbi:DUF1758 domain-containing protein [Trichonephila clavipes]|nr:DUF1758 domain-containing protein [Trichonephila clavipes]